MSRANAQRDGRSAEHRWRPLFNAAKFGWRSLPCSNAAKTWNPLKLAGVPQTPEPISAASGPKFTILWGHLEEILLLNKFFPIVDMCLSCEDIAWQSCAMVPRWWFLATFFASCIFSEPRAARNASGAVLNETVATVWFSTGLFTLMIQSTIFTTSASVSFTGL